MNGTTKKVTSRKAVGKEKNGKPVKEVQPKTESGSGLKSKRKKTVPINSTSSDSDSDQFSNSTVKYTFSQAPQTFEGILASAGSTMRGKKVTTEKLMEKYKDHKSLQIFQKDESESSSSSSYTQNGQYHPKPKPKKASKAKSSAVTSESVLKTLTVGFNYDLPSSSNALLAQMYPLDMPVSEGQMTLADLPTDTELEVEEICVNKSKKFKKVVPKNTCRRQDGLGKKAIIISEQVSSSSSSSSDSLNDTVELDFDASPSPSVATLTAQHCLHEIGQMRIRIQLNGQVYKFLGNEGWDMAQVRLTLSELTEVPENELLIYTKDNEKMTDGKTLSHYKIEGGDVLDAMRRTVETEKPIVSPAKHHVEKITLKFQKAGLKKPIIMDVSKFSSLKEIRSFLALKLPDVDDKQLYFHFDGENIDLVQTPEELGLEDNDCIDVFVKSQ